MEPITENHLQETSYLQRKAGKLKMKPNDSKRKTQTSPSFCTVHYNTALSPGKATNSSQRGKEGEKQGGECARERGREERERVIEAEVERG